MEEVFRGWLGGVGRSCVAAAARGGVGGREPESWGRPERDGASQTTAEGPLKAPAGQPTDRLAGRLTEPRANPLHRYFSETLAEKLTVIFIFILGTDSFI